MSDYLGMEDEMAADYHRARHGYGCYTSVCKEKLARLERVAETAREAYDQMSSFSRFPKERAARVRLGAALDALDEEIKHE